MKKRILSAFLALSMLFSIMPTTFAQQEIDSDGNITGTPNMVTDLKIKITEGVLTQFDVTFGDGLNNPDDYFVLLATDLMQEPVMMSQTL